MLIIDDCGLSCFKFEGGEESTENQSKNYNLVAKSTLVEICTKYSVNTGEKDPDPENFAAETVPSHILKIGSKVFHVDQDKHVSSREATCEKSLRYEREHGTFLDLLKEQFAWNIMNIQVGEV